MKQPASQHFEQLIMPVNESEHIPDMIEYVKELVNNG